MDTFSVARAVVGGKAMFGVNSAAGKGYSQTHDGAVVKAMRGYLHSRYGPRNGSSHYSGRRAQDALCHAEFTVLFRLARVLGGSLRGQKIDMLVERALSSHCKYLLPIVALEMGNPEIILNGPLDDVFVVHDGKPLDPESPTGRSHRFGRLRGAGWPALDSLSHLFLADYNLRWSYEGYNDSWELDIRGLQGTASLPPFGYLGNSGKATQIEAHLSMEGHPLLGVLMEYTRFGGGLDECYYSRGKPTLSNPHFRTLHSDLRPAELYIPFSDAWPAVKEFMETDGELPKCIPWITSNDLPDNTFPVPHDPNIVAIND